MCSQCQRVSAGVGCSDPLVHDLPRGVPRLINIVVSASCLFRENALAHHVHPVRLALPRTLNVLLLQRLCAGVCVFVRVVMHLLAALCLSHIWIHIAFHSLVSYTCRALVLCVCVFVCDLVCVCVCVCVEVRATHPTFFGLACTPTHQPTSHPA